MEQAIDRRGTAMGQGDAHATGGQDRLPELLRPLFWDCDFEQLDWNLQRSFVVGRVLAEGTRDAISWLRARLGDAELSRWIRDHEGRPLTSQQLRFWELILGLPGDEVNRWLAQDSRRIWHERIS